VDRQAIKRKSAGLSSLIRVMALLEVIEHASSVARLATGNRTVPELNQQRKKDLAINVVRWDTKLAIVNLLRMLELVSDVVKSAIVKKPALLLRKQSNTEKKLALNAERKDIRKKTALRLMKTRLEIGNVSSVARKATGDMSALLHLRMERAKECWHVLNVESLVIAN
jgi:hypothetical protein